jgi:ABC-type multidrug transport system fused ATPase/permease subunit
MWTLDHCSQLSLAGVAAGTKVGVVWMTDSERYSMMVALFRLVELSEGQILIDGQDSRIAGIHSQETDYVTQQTIRKRFRDSPPHPPQTRHRHGLRRTPGYG